jgi:glycosyltransferase involved in cell wall biosynthesis
MVGASSFAMSYFARILVSCDIEGVQVSMKVLIQQFLSKNHSWSIVGQSIARSLIKQNHEVHLFSTNGTQHFPEDLTPNLMGYVDETDRQVYGQIPAGEYDCQISYTAPKNFSQYLSHGAKNRFGIWCYEFAGKNALPDGFAKCYKDTDMMLPPSTFAKQVFADSGVPNERMTVVPHGIDFALVDSATHYPLRTKKSNKILIVVAQVHRRKNFAGMLEMYGEAFTKKDDVCLVIKVQDREPQQAFEQSFKELMSRFNDKYRNHGEVEIIREFVPNIYSLYKSCDIVFSASHCEGFGITALDAHALGKINVVSNYGGFLDFSNADNSLLIEGSEFLVPPNYLYWATKTRTKAFMPNLESGVEKLRYAVKHKDELLAKYQANIELAKTLYNWDTITNQIIGLTSHV